MLLLLGLLSPFLLDRLFPFPFERTERPASLLILDQEGRPLRVFLPADDRFRLPVDLDQVPSDLIAAFVASEDQRFWNHSGVDLLAVLRATGTNLRAGRVVSGASTLSMQVARMALGQRRTLRAKFVEALRALQLEQHRSKEEILALYLDLAPFGGNVEGIGAASWSYFGKAPAALSAGEIAFLTILPRAPNRYDPSRGPEAADAALKVRDEVLAALARRGVWSAEEATKAIAQPLPRRRLPFPFRAPHGTAAVREHVGAATGSMRSTLDLDLQRAAEERLSLSSSELQGAGVGNAAAVLVENSSRAVRALVGSADFFDVEHQGQVDGTRARRSPGSTLKPFLYTMAFDEGHLVPDSWLLDVPRDYAGYVAENYDGRYRGRVTARAALGHSLNAPAVRLLAEVGLDSFLRRVRRGGLESLDRPAGHYGLPLILGAGETTLVELTELYAALAEGGHHRPLRWSEEEPLSEGDRLFSSGAVALVREILEDVERPDLPASWRLTRDAPAIAWKTGTSYGHRDAWAIGWTDRWTIGVWVGNFDGRPVRGISGAENAGPLLFDLFRIVESRGAATPVTPVTPATRRSSGASTVGLGGGFVGERNPAQDVELCAVSRLLPNDSCPERIRVPSLAGTTRLARCKEHRRVFLDAETGELLGGPCLGERPHRSAVLTFPPPELLAWRRARGEEVVPLPRPRPGCGQVAVTEPRIVSPSAQTPYRRRASAPADFQRLALIARVDPRVRKLYWYQDGELVATASPSEQRFLPLEAGRHRLVVVDDSGGSDSLDYVVEADGQP